MFGVYAWRGMSGWWCLRIGTVEIAVRLFKHFKAANSKNMSFGVIRNEYPEEHGGRYWLINLPFMMVDVEVA